MVRSLWPVATIVNAHLDGGATLEEAGEKLRSGQTEDALVWRVGMRPRVRVASPGEADWLAACDQQLSLGSALDAAPALDFGAWLPMAAQTGLLLAAELIVVSTRCRPDPASR